MSTEESENRSVSRPAFWEEIYRAGRSGWDLGHAALWFEDLLASPDRPKPGRLSVVGSGTGHDALLFAANGFDVTGFDFAPSAIEASRAAAAKAGSSATFVQADIFALAASYSGAFDYVVEHACFTAIDPARRPEYVEVVSALLRPGGELIGLFLVENRSGGPPFSTDPDELHRLFDELFTFEHLAPLPRSAEQRRGRELAGRMRRRVG